MKPELAELPKGSRPKKRVLQKQISEDSSEPTFPCAVPKNHTDATPRPKKIGRRSSGAGSGRGTPNTSKSPKHLLGGNKEDGLGWRDRATMKRRMQGVTKAKQDYNLLKGKVCR